jgi:DNA polymerase I-like protein with 3'-5' exonuclease and polymerase domains
MRTFSCDIETDGIEATKVWCIAVHNINTDQCITFAGPCLNLFKPWLESEADCLIFHNGISFDVPVLERLLDVDFSNIKIEDTLVLSQLYKPRLDGGHSLSAWGDRLDYEKGDHTDWSQFSEEMMRYCIRDAKLTTKLYKYLSHQGLNNYRLSKDATQLEYAIKKHCSMQERNGWYFNLQGAMKLLQEINEDLRLAEVEVHKTFVPLPVWKSKKPVANRFTKDGKRTKHYQTEVELECHTNEKGEYGYWTYPELNLGSRQQVGRHLIHYGWKPTVFTDAGQPKVDESTLKDVDIPEAKIIARYLMLQKRQGQVSSWVDEYNYDTGRIHSRVHTMGTVTHRMSSSNPNLQQVTASNKEYGSEMRSLFTVPEDKVIVGADLSGLELRCLAHYMKDDSYTEEILSGDIHTANQKAAGLKTRDESKRFIYAYLYGGGDALIGKICGGGMALGKKIKEQFLSNTPALAVLRKRIEHASKKGWIKALDGRKVYVRSPHSALNFLLQSAGAIIAKRAWEIFHILADGYEYKQLGVIHDEIQIECDPAIADEIGSLVVEAMEQTTDYYKLNCPITGEYKIGKSWNETH